MTDYRGSAQRRIGGAQPLHELDESLVLGLLVGDVVAAFELDADRKIVARASAAVLGFPSVPSAIRERNVLSHAAVPADEHVRRYTHMGYRSEVLVGVRRQRIRKETIDPWSAEFRGRQADSMDDDEVERAISRPWIAVRRPYTVNVHEPTRFHIDQHGNSNAA
jgi:hypothetical protein